jgi:hypothetical protein
MAVIKAQLHGGPLDGKTVAINVEDPNNPPELRDIGFKPRRPGAPAVLYTYRRVARNPILSMWWDYEATGQAHGIREGRGPVRRRGS